MKRAASRNFKIGRISQAHVAPGMSVERLNAILQQHGVAVAGSDPWAAIPATTLDAIIADISAVVSPPVPLPPGGQQPGGAA